MPNILLRIIAISFLSAFASGAFGARIKDITSVKGARSNQLYGYGIVVGLAGQGDSKIEYTQVGILNALESLGIRVDKADKSRDIAAVIITAEIGPFVKEGSKIDVLVSSAGDADSFQGIGRDHDHRLRFRTPVGRREAARSMPQAPRPCQRPSSGAQPLPR